jgi:hypothetical protein
MLMETGAYNIVEDTQTYPRYTARMSIMAFLRLAWREAAPPASEVTVTGLDTLLSSVPDSEQAQVARLIHDTLQDVANLMGNRHQTVQFVLRGTIDRGQHFEVRQPDSTYVNLSAIFGNRLKQKANDWLTVSLWF